MKLQPLKEKLAAPIIFVIAHGDAAAMNFVKATRPFGYIMKPFEQAEVYSAVEIALFLHGTEQELRQRASDLEGLLEKKRARLREAERLAIIGETATLVGHDLRNRLQVLMNLTFDVKRLHREWLFGHLLDPEIPNLARFSVRVQ